MVKVKTRIQNKESKENVVHWFWWHSAWNWKWTAWLSRERKFSVDWTGKKEYIEEEEKEEKEKDRGERLN